MREGIVFDIKEFAVFDGPGIRTTVFMKGCPLRCQWCHNPEGLSREAQLMVSAAACTKCGACMAVCPVYGGVGRTPREAGDALHEIGNLRPEQKATSSIVSETIPAGPIPDGCLVCGACIPVCKGGLRKIAGTKWQADKLAARLAKDKDVYELSGGGVTFSGGDPLYQWDFVSEVIRSMPGIHTAVETSGFTSDEVFADVMQTVSLVMMDWKVSDPEKHLHFTGGSQEPIRRHAKMLAEGDTPFILRMPMIPGVNDDLAHFETVAELVSGAKRLVRIDILPYQQAAGAKYEMVGKTYRTEFDGSVKPHYFTEVFDERGIPYQIFR